MRASLLGFELARQAATACNRRVATGPDQPFRRRLFAERPPVHPLVAASDPGAVAEPVQSRLERGLGGVARAVHGITPEAEVVELVRIPLAVVALDLVGRHALPRHRIGNPGMLD